MAGTIKEIPATACAIKVTNVASPRHMIIYHEENYTDRLAVISNKLQSQIVKHRKRKQQSSTPQPQIGNIVIIHNRLESEMVLPASWLRGILGPMDMKTLQFNVFLVDHGYVIQAHREDFTIISKTVVPDEYLSLTVGLYNVVPTLRETEKSDGGVNMKMEAKWNEHAVQITRDCISASSKMYFDHLAEGDGGKKYGELYLVLENDIFSLSEILVRNQYAIYLRKDWLSLRKERNCDILNTIDSLDDGIVVGFETRNFDPPGKHRIPIDNGKNKNDKKHGKRIYGVKEKHKLLRYLGEDCQQILVNSNVDCERLVSIEDARFPATIHAVLRRLKIIALRRIQSYIWPAVSKGLNVLAIGPPNCGKTFGHVLPVVSSIASWKTVPSGNNPTVLILCSSTSGVLSISSLCNELLEVYTDIRSVAGWNGRPDKSLVAEIYNGCQILVATPAFLARFLNQSNEYRKLINFENLSYLIIDGIDVILDKYYEPLQKLFRRHIVIGNKERANFDKEPLQIVVVARHWTPLVSAFAKECMTDPYVCIGSYMEAAIFGRVMPKLTVIESSQKIQKVTELLDDQVSMMKTMIICGNSNEAHALNDHLSKTKKTLVACEKMMFTEIQGVREIWKASVSGLYPILVCTDEILIDLNITDVDWLIHFSATLPSKTQFYFRFSTLMDNLKKAEGKCKVRILVDETNDVQLYGVVSVVKNCGTKIPPKFMEKVMRIVAGLDMQKKMYPICDNVKAFGACPKKNVCPYRHCVLAGIDTPVTPIKIGDKVRLTVTYVHNATHFTARVMEYTSSNNEVTRYSAGEYTRISSAIQTYYADKCKRRCHKKIKVGDICAVEESLDNFQRVKVLNIVARDYEGVPLCAELKCIDTGAILPKISVTRLMEIPNDLANRDTHIVEVFLAGLVPYDDEHEWNCRAIDAAHNWFPDKTKLNSFVLGTVRLHLADTLWVDPLEIRTPIIGHPELINSSLKTHMLKLKHGESNKQHLVKLYDLCRIGSVRNAEGEEIVPATMDIQSENDPDSLL